jgi:hypothetical protein
MTATDEHLITGVQGRWLGPRGIFCHRAPDASRTSTPRTGTASWPSTRWSPRSQTGRLAFGVN